MMVMSLVAAGGALLIGILGPLWAMNMSYTQAQEKNLRIINVSKEVSNSFAENGDIID
jgi:hypothetical protein